MGDVGIGSIVSLGNERETGARTVSIDDKGSLQVAYTEFPSYTTLYRQGSDPSGPQGRADI